jgi:MATE family multidrug resistance protein
MNKEILRLAIPNIISNISVPLLSSVDTALMGRMSAAHIGAVGLGAMIFNFIYWNFGFLRMGTTGLTAQAFGQADREGQILTLGRATVLVLGIAAFLILLQEPLARWSVVAMNVPGEQVVLVRDYFLVRIWAAPATLMSYALIGWFFGMQNAIYPLIWVLVVNGVNMLLSFYLVYTLDMGIIGVAYGTLLAQYLGLVVGVGLFLLKYRELLPVLPLKQLFDWQAFSRFLRVNRDIFLRTLLLTLSFAIFYNRSSASGSLILAVNVILLQFVNWMSYGIDGFAYASESLVGKYYGAGDRGKFDRSVRLTFVWGMGMALAYGLAYLFFGESLLRIFTNQSDVIEAALGFLVWMVAFPLLSTPCYLFDGIYIGLTASGAMRNSMMLAFGLFLVLVFTVGSVWGNHGLWVSLLGFMVARGTFQGFLFRRHGWELR